MDRKEFKSAAKEQIKGKIGVLFVINLIVSLITSAASGIPGLGILCGLIVTPAFAIALVRIYLGVTAGKKPEIGDVFNSFGDFWIAFKVGFLTGLFTFLWSLLFIIPGIIKTYSYSMAMYIVAEDPSIGALEAISRSEKMMRGHKMEYFILQLSFIGWILLGLITLGIAFIYAGPYMQTASANFYNKVNPYNKVKPVEEIAESAE